MIFIQSLFQSFSLSASLPLFAYVFYLKFYFSYNFKYHMISASSYFDIIASAQPIKHEFGTRVVTSADIYADRALTRVL
jgi:hypothetical protein